MDEISNISNSLEGSLMDANSNSMMDSTMNSNMDTTLNSALDDSTQNAMDTTLNSTTMSSGITEDKAKRRRRKKRPPHKTKVVTGYIIYASEIRKEVIKKYPDRDFGFISKLVGIDWKKLPQEVKNAFEKRAQEQNAKSKALAEIERKKMAETAQTNERLNNQSMGGDSRSPPPTTNGHSYQSNGYMSHDLTNQDTNDGSHGSDDTSMHANPTSPSQRYESNSQKTTTTYSSGQPQRNNIVYRKPATVRLRPKEVTTQTDPIVWVEPPPKKPLKFSQKFIEYLAQKD